MRISEVFDKPYEYKIPDRFGKYTVIKFDLDNGDQCDVIFYRPNNAEPLYTVAFMIELSYDITGEGDPYRVFATVVKIIREFKQRVPEAIIKFSAHEPSRRKLYTKMAHVLTKKYNFDLMRVSDEETNGVTALTFIIG